MTVYLLKVHLQTFLAVPITQKCQILCSDALVANVEIKKKKVYLDRTLYFLFLTIFAVNSYCFIYSVNRSVFVMESCCEVGTDI